MFNQYPYINLNDFNLDYILKAIKEMRYEVTNFVSINAIKYADPIQWNITSQYEKNTIVIDPQTGTAYISVAPVPAGVALTRPEYWTVVFDLGSFVTRAAQNFTDHWESDTTTTATFSTPAGGWLVWGDVLYKALVNITAGDAYVVGSNIEHFTIEDVYNAITSEINTIISNIGDLANLTTSDRTDIVSAINSVLSDLNLKVGDLANLNTSDKSDIVNAINEVLNDISSVDPTDKTYVNVKDYGAKGDGVTDDTQAINDAIAVAGNSNVVFFPKGTYLTSGHTLTTSTGFMGCGPQSRIIGTDNTKPIFEYDGIDLALLQIRNLYLDRQTPATSADVNANGIVLNANCSGQGLLIDNIAFYNQYNSFSALAVIAGSTIRDCLVIASVGSGYYFESIWYVYNCQAQNCNIGFLVSGANRTIAGFYFDGCTAYRTVSAGFMVDGSVNAVYDVMFRGCVAGSNRTGGYAFYGAGGNHTLTSCYSEYAGYSDESKSDPNAIVNASSIYAQNQAGMIISDFYEFESAYSGIALVNCNQVKVSNCIARGNDYSGVYMDYCAKIDITNCNFNGLSLSDYGIVSTQVLGASSEIVIDGADIRDCTTAVYIYDATVITLKNCKGYSPTITTPTLTDGVAVTNNNVCDVMVIVTGEPTAATVDNVGIPSPTSGMSFVLKKGKIVTIAFTNPTYWAWIPLD